MEEIAVHLDQFEGPLPLLLSLIQKHKLNIYDISILELVDQYMGYIRLLKENQAEVASSFLEMAARLVYIKSATLLPRYEGEADELKSELEGQLLEYHVIQAVARKLAGRYVGNMVFVRQQIPFEVNLTYRGKQDKKELLKALFLAAGKKKERAPLSEQTFTGIVHQRAVSVDSRIIYVLHRLYTDPVIPFESFFIYSENISEKVATFLAVLELIKDGRIHLSREGKVTLGQATGQKGDAHGS